MPQQRDQKLVVETISVGSLRLNPQNPSSIARDRSARLPEVWRVLVSMCRCWSTGTTRCWRGTAGS